MEKVKKINIYLKYRHIDRNDKAFIAMSRYIGYKLNVDLQFHIVAEVAYFTKNKTIITDEQDNNYNIVRKSICVKDHPDELFVMIDAKCRADMLPGNTYLITTRLRDRQLSGVGNVHYIPSFSSTTILSALANIFSTSYFEEYDKIRDRIKEAFTVSDIVPYSNHDDLDRCINVKPILNMLIYEANHNPSEKLFKRLDRCLECIESISYPEFYALLLDVFKDESTGINYINPEYMYPLIDLAVNCKVQYQIDICNMLSVLSYIVYKVTDKDFEVIDDKGTNYQLLEMSDFINSTNLSTPRISEIPRMLKNTSEHKIIFKHKTNNPLPMTYMYSNFIKPYSGTLLTELVRRKSDDPDDKVLVVL